MSNSRSNPWPQLARIALPISTAILISVWWGSIVQKEDRAISLYEFSAAASALFLSGQPILASELIRAAMRKFD